MSKYSGGKRRPRRARPVIEGLEPRILLSADLPGLDTLASEADRPHETDIAQVLSDAQAAFEPEATEDEAQPITSGAVDAPGLDVVPEESTGPELIIVDAGVDDYQSLITDLTQDAEAGRTFQIFVLDAQRDGVAQISEILAANQDLAAVHLISHGTDGAIQLGSSVVDHARLQQDSASIQGWGEALADAGDILIYGCDLAASAAGESFVDTLAGLTGADVAASDDLTGHASQGGDWELEFRAGNIESGLVFAEGYRTQWTGTLDITTDLVAHYAFDEGVGTTAGDSSTTGNDGVLYSSPTWTAGHIGSGALDFGGDYDRIEAPDHAALDFGTGDFSVSFWFNSTHSGSTGRLMGDLNGGDGFIFYADGFGDLVFQVSSGFDDVILDESGLFDGEWHHVVGMRSGSNFSLYVDDVLADSMTHGGMGSITNSETLRIGASSSSHNEFDGLMDEVRIYDRALSTSDIGELFDTTDDPPHVLQAVGTSGGGLDINTDGGDDVYLVADDGDAIFAGKTKLTTEVRFAMDAVANDSNFFSYATSGDANEFMFWIKDNGDIRWEIGGDNVGSNAIDYRTLADGDPHTLSMTWDSSGGLWEIYVDGALTDSGSGFANGISVDPNGTLVFGNDQDSVGGSFETDEALKATLYDVRVFDDVRSAVEIAANYASDLPHDEANLVANWRFDQLSSGGVVTDTVSGNNLTVAHASGGAFVTSTPSLSFTVEENALDGALVGIVGGEDAQRDALTAALLAADSDLSYSAETGKFYKVVNSTGTWSAASSAALTTMLNGVGGELATIGSAAENAFVHGLIGDLGNAVWLGASDAVNEGEWRWYSGGSIDAQFWRGDTDGYATDGAYQNWLTNEPNNDTGTDPLGEHYLYMETDGTWNDIYAGANWPAYIVQWDADAVLDNAGGTGEQPLTYAIQSQTVSGAFAVDADNGRITVADGSLLDFESDPTHSLTVRVTDVDGNFLDQSFDIALQDLAESAAAPTDLSSGIELNADGGNDAYLISAGGLSQSLSATTVEIRFAAIDNPDETVLMSFNNPTDDEFSIQINEPTNVLELDFGAGTEVNAGAIDYRAALVDGDVHTLSVTWDATNGDWAIFIDGEFIESGTALSAGSALDTTNGQFVFGQEQDGLDTGYDSTQYFSGTYYDVRIWNEVRGAEEIALHYQQKIDSGSPPGSLVANWQMDGFNGSNQVVDVISGNNLSIAHAAGAGFTASTAVVDLNINENSANGTSVGYVVPHEADLADDVVSDGLLTEAGSAAGNPTYYASGAGAGSVLGGWTVVTESVDYVGNIDPPPLGGNAIDLSGDQPGAIEQTLTTEVGRQYQVIFAGTGNFSGGADAVKTMRASAAGQSEDFDYSEPTGWDWVNSALWEQRSFTFTADSTSTDLRFESLASDGWGPLIANIQVVEIPAAVTTILNNDASLSYDAGTGKFYRLVSTPADWADAQTVAIGSSLNGVNGQLVTIDSDYENSVIWDLARSIGSDVLIGASDQTIEGEWRWYDGNAAGEQFWSGDKTGGTVGNAYANWVPNEPSASFATEDYARLEADTGLWKDNGGGTAYAYVVEWDAGDVLSNYTFSLTDDAGGRFAIDSETGEITVADGSKLDYETDPSHTVDVRVTDSNGNTHDETMTILVNDVADGGTPPVISDLGGDSLAYTEGDGAVVIDQSGNAAVSDVDSSDFDTGTLTVSFEAGSDNAEDVLDVRHQGTGAGQIGVSGSTLSYQGVTIGTFTGGGGGADLVITLNASADATAVGALINNITYENTDTADPTEGARTVRFVLTDGDGGTSADYDTTVTVSGVNDTPTIGGDETGSVTEDVDPDVDTLLETSGTLTISDPDAGESSFQAETVNGTYGDLAIDTAGNWSYSADNTQTAIQQLDLGESVNDVLTVTTADGTTHDVTITINGAEDAPTIDNPIGDQVATEDAAFNFTFAANAFDDVDASDSLTYTATLSDDSALPAWLSFNDTTRTFSGTPTNADVGTISVKVVANDGTSTVGDVFDITINNTNDVPVNTVPGAQAVNEDAVLAISGISVSDDDDNLDTVRLTVNDGVLNVTLSGGASISAGSNGTGDLTLSGSLADINATLASLTYRGDLHFNGSDTLTVLSTDLDSATDSDVVSITVNPVNDAPVIRELNADFVTALDDGVAVNLDAAAAADILDHDSQPDYDGGSLQITGSGFDGADQLGIDTSGTITLSAGFANGSSVSVGGVAIGSLSGVTNAGATLSLNSDATEIRVESVLQSLTFSSTSSVVGARDIDITLTDGDGTANGGTDSDTVSLTVNLASSSDGAVTTNEDTPHVFSANDFTFSGVTAANLRDITVTTLPASGTLELNSVAVTVGQTISKADIDAGLLTYEPVADANGVNLASFDFYINDGLQSVTVLPGQSSAYTINSTALVPTDDILVDSDNFGASGTVTTHVNFGAQTGTVDAGYLSGGDILFDGFVVDAGIDAGELAAIDAWVNAGGILISTSDSAAYDPVSSHYGLTIGGTGSATWHVANDTHAIMDGPFGQVGNVGDSFSASGTISYFNSASLDPGDQILATDSGSGEPTIVLRQHGSGAILFMSDEGPFRASMTGGGAVATPNDIFAANVFAWAIDQLPEESHHIDISVTAVNDDPTNDGSLPGDRTVVEDVSTALDLSAIDLADVDALTGTMTVTLQTSTGGMLTASTGGGVTVTGSGTGTLQLDGTLGDLNTFLDGGSNIQYLHGTSHTFGDNADSVAITVNDNGNSGIGGGTDISLGSVNIDITAVDDAPVIGGTNSGSVTEDVDPDVDTLLETSGTLTISDPDPGESSFQAATINGTYGDLTIDTAGNWSYAADNTQAAIQALDVGESVNDVLTVTTADGTTHDVTITINGDEDAPVITGTTTGSVTEDGTLTANGTLAISDIDTSDNPISFPDEGSTLGDNGYGDFALTGGTWTYTLNNAHAAVQALDNGESLTDTHTFTASDGSTQLVTVTINGAEDAPIITGTTTGAVTEDGTLTANGTLAISDTDTSDNPISFPDAASTLGDNGYGDFALTGGTWTYTLNNAHAAVQALDNGESLTDTHTFTASDGSTQLVTVTINGAEDAPVITGTTTGSVTEDGTLTANGTLAISDTDTSDNPVSFPDEVSTLGDNGYGDFELTGGTWTYTLNNAHAAVQALDNGETLTDTHTFTASDGSTQVVTVTINGAEDAPVISGTTTGSVTEDGTLTANGTLAISDTDTSDNPISFPDEASTLGDNGYGDFALTGGTWTYTLNNAHAAVQALDNGESLTDTHTFTASDGSTQLVTVTINGAEDAPVITGTTTGSVTEDGTLTANGTLAISDTDTSDNPISFPDEASTLGDNGYGDFALTGGTWTYTLNNAHAAVQALDNGETLTDTHTFTASDGSTQLVTVTINGAEDAPTVANLIGDQIATEDSAFNFTFAANAFGDVDTSDTLTYTATLSDNSALPAWLSFDDTTRTFSGTPTNADVGTISVKVVADDGSSTVFDVFDITVNNTNDAPVIGGVDTGTVTEDVDPDVDTLLEASGALTITDPDIGESNFQAATIVGTYGSLTIDAAGNWDYAADNTQAAIQALDVGESVNDVLTVTTADGTTHDVTITIHGAEDAPVISGTTTGAVTEDGTLTANGALSITDADTSDNPVSFPDAASTLGDNGYGDFALTGGTWTYTLNNAHAAVQALDNGESLTDTHTFTASDGSTQLVTVTINGAEDAPVITGTTTGSVTEDGTLTANGTLAISDTDTSDNPISFPDEASTLGDNGYGDFALTGGTWTYTLNNAHAAVQALDAGESITDTHTFTASDGSIQLVTVTINGAEDAPVITATATGSVTEDGTLTANGTLAISDVDTSDNPISFPDAANTLGDNGYGDFALTGGTWTYTLNNAHAAVQALDAGETLTDTHTFTASDGSTQLVTVTINGAEDAPVITGTTTGSVTEDGTLTANGTLAISDVDTSDNPVSFPDEASTLGDNGYGDFALSAGTWTYTLNNAHTAVQALDTGETLTDTHTFTASDGSTQLVTVTINGAEDAPVITGTTTGAVTEDGTLTANGTLAISDTDTSDNPVSFPDAASTAGDNGYGDFALTGSTWTYTLNNAHAAVQALDAGETLTDTHTFTASDGSNQIVTITINGAEDAPVITATATGSVTEDDTLTANGTLAIADTDTSDNPVSFPDAASTLGDNGYGDFALTGGTWTYKLNNAHAAVQALDTGETLSDTHTFTASDGSTQVVTVTINGAEDAPVITGTTTGSVTEDGTLTANGTLAIADTDTSDNPVSFPDAASTAGDNGYGDFALTAGTWTYTLDNAHAAVQALDAGETLTDTHAFTASDGSTQVVSVTVNGTEDAPVITGTTIGAVAEDSTLVTTGTLAISDADTADGPVAFADEASTLGDSGYGDFALTAGTWTYTLNNDHAAVQALNGGETLTDSHTFTASDGSTQTVTVTIDGGAEPEPSDPRPTRPSGPEITSAVGPVAVELPVVEAPAPEPEDLEPEAEAEPSADGQAPVPWPDPVLPAAIEPGDLVLSVLSERTPAPAEGAVEKPTAQSAKGFLQELKALWRPEPPPAEVVEVDFKTAQDGQFWRELEQMSDDLDRSAEETQRQTQLNAEAAAGVSISLTAGFVSWALRAGSLVASFLAAMPTWRNFDPMPILSADEKTRQTPEDDERNLTDDAAEVDKKETTVDDLFDR